MMSNPYASIIIPAFNAEEKITGVLNAIQQQTYPSDRFEVLVVDNGSTDRTQQKVAAFDGIKLLEETAIQNPYAARNKGLRHAKGDILVLLDVNCTPAQRWLEAGIKRLQKGEADLAGGQISFTFSPDETLSEWYDSLLFVDMEDLIRRGGSCAGGNLFFKRKVLNAIGLFPQNKRSGMDLYWTKKATDQGFSLVYEKDAEVTYPARPFRPLFKKILRVGTGQPKMWLDDGRHPLKMAAAIAYQLIPAGTQTLKDKIDRRGKKEMYSKLGQLWGLQYLKQLTIALGWTKGFFNYYFS